MHIAQHHLSHTLRCAIQRRTVQCAALLALLFTATLADALTLTAVQSRKLHGTAGSFDLKIDTAPGIGGAITVEPRAIGAGHQIVFQFDAPIIPNTIGVPSAIDETGAVIAALTLSATANEAIVTITNLADSKRVTVSLANVNGVGLDVVASLGFLLGDVSNSQAIAPNDVQQLKARSGYAVDNSNFQFDLNTTGWITAADISAVKARGNRSLPAVQITYALSVGKTGTGAGTVTSSPAGINCGTACSQNIGSGSVVTLTATAGAGSTFTGWGGACTGTGACSVTMDAAKSVSAAFTLNAIVVPPDPGSVAPPIDPTVATDIATATAFLYTGANPIQTGVAPGTIVGQRAAVLRGKVQTRAGAVLPGVTITILAHPEFGQTISRADGAFDLAVNGGGPLTVNYQKAGFLPVQRAVVAPWRDYAWLPDVVMIPFDTAVTTVDFTSASMQTARGSSVSDIDGARQATILFPTGTTAVLVLPNGSTQPLTTLNVRATEFTIGDSGLKAMPAPLPPSSGYTYAVELSVDEAVAAGAIEVRFSQPVPTYVENFLGFPVGGAVPTGYYDRQKGQWIASANGRVIKVLAINGGLADLDTDGDAVADDATKLTALGITTDERTRLAQLYAAGQTLWRIPVTHFTPWDFNWPYGPPSDAVRPREERRIDPPDEPNEECGSVIGCEDQTLGESLPVTGAAWRLHYRSKRTPGRKEANAIKIQVSGPTIPASLRNMRVEVLIAGQKHEAAFPAAPNVFYAVAWTGTDAYGRPLTGTRDASIRVHYDYVPQYYASRSDFEAGFARAEARGLTIVGATRQTSVFTLSSAWTQLVGSHDARAFGLGGWNLGVQHAYNPVSHTLLLGNGLQRTGGALPSILNTVVGGLGQLGFSGDGGLAKAAQIRNPSDVAGGPDGSLYFSDFGNHRVRRIGPDGIVTTIAGTSPGFGGDGGPATAAQLNRPTGIAVGADRSLFIADRDNIRIRRVGPDGIITTFAGNGVPGFGGDGGPATAATISAGTHYIAASPDGSVYISDAGNARVRRVGTDGIITTIAGSGSVGFSGDGGLATAAKLNSPRGIAIGLDGSLYIADSNNRRIRRVAPDGIITTFAGDGGPFSGGDGGPAELAQFFSAEVVAVGPDGSVYIPDDYNCQIRRVGADGIVTRVAGNTCGPSAGDGGAATAPDARMNSAVGVTVGADGNLFAAYFNDNRVRVIKPVLPDFLVSDVLLAADDGSELYVFNRDGRHLKTIDALTGAIRYQFTYSATGYLTSMADGSGNVTTIERTGAAATAIVAPGGQRTTLNVSATGWLLSLVNPASETHSMGYSADGLLQTFTDPRGNVHQFTYDGLGRLTRDDNPAGGMTTLARTEQSNGYTVTTTTALGRTRSYQVEKLPIDAVRRTLTDASGAKTITVTSADSSKQNTYADGSSMTSTFGPDPRWGMLVPVLTRMVETTPGGRTRTVTTVRTATLSDPNNVLSLTNLTDTITDNGAVSSRVYTSNGTSRTLTDTSAAARSRSIALDALGRVTQVQVLGLDPVAYTYESRGLISSITEGSGAAARTTTLAYNAALELTGVTDALGGTTGLTYDSAGRLVSAIRPGARTIALGYDASGNLTALTPPGKGAHAFAYDSIDQTASYTPPDLGSGTTTTQLTYDTDRALTLVTRPDGQLIDFTYDSAGRPGTVAIARGAIGYSYSPTTSQLTGITAPGALGLSYTRDSELLTGITWSGAVSGVAGYTYNNDMRVTTETVNAANSVSFTYAADGLLSSAGSLALTRNAQNGLLTGSTLGSVTDSHLYNTLAEHSSYSASYSATPIYNTAYTRDALGRITQVVETIGGVTSTFAYAYNVAGRLNAVSKDAVALSSYTYDLNGNRTARTGPAVAATHDAQDRLTAYGGTTYSYTANGELLGKVNGAQTTAYQYDALGNLLKVTLPDATVIDYLIDGQNRRIGRKVNGSLVQGFLYQNSLRPVAELNGSNVLVSRFVYATRVNVPDYMVKGGVTYRIIADLRGSPRLVVDVATGTVAQRIDYDEFGQVLNDSNPGFQPFGFAGGLYDKDTKLVRFGARDYDAETGRWTAKDPIGFAGRDTNLYAYVGGDPVNFIDSTGLAPVCTDRLTVRSRDTSLLTNPDARAERLRRLQPGEQVRWLGFDRATGFDRVEVTLPDDSTITGYVLRQNLQSSPVLSQSDPGGDKPMDTHSFSSSAAGTRG